MENLPPLERGLAILELAAASKNGFSWKQAHECLGDISSATVSKVLKVLVLKEFLIKDNSAYKTGPAIKRLLPSMTVKDLLINQGPLLAEEFSEYIQESCVVAYFDQTRFKFTGVQIIEGSMGYSPPGTTITVNEGHVFTQLLHSQQDEVLLKKRFDSGKIDFGHKGETPDWKEYCQALCNGRKEGIFLEYGWRRSHAYRMAIPVFNDDLSLAGAFMCGYPNAEILHQRISQNLAASMKVMGRISGYEKIFEEGVSHCFKKVTSSVKNDKRK